MQTDTQFVMSTANRLAALIDSTLGASVRDILVTFPDVPTEDEKAAAQFIRNQVGIWPRETLRKPAQFALLIWGLLWWVSGSKPTISREKVLELTKQVIAKVKGATK